MQYLQTILYLVIGRFPILITISTIFIAGTISGFRASIISTLTVIGIILFSIIITLTVSKILSKTIIKGFPSSFILELPPYRKPQIGRIIIRSFFDKTLSILWRAIKVSAPAGLIIWLLANTYINRNKSFNIICSISKPFCSFNGIRWLYPNCFYTRNSRK